MTWYRNSKYLVSYSGDWIEDKRHGKGTHKYTYGNVYSGDWINWLIN
jgi:hypothetical protein